LTLFIHSSPAHAHNEQLNSGKADKAGVVSDVIAPAAISKISGGGMPYPDDNSKYGDLYITFDVAFPTGLSESTRKGMITLLYDHVPPFLLPSRLPIHPNLSACQVQQRRLAAQAPCSTAQFGRAVTLPPWQRKQVPHETATSHALCATPIFHIIQLDLSRHVPTGETSSLTTVCTHYATNPALASMRCSTELAALLADKRKDPIQYNGFAPEFSKHRQAAQ